MFEGGEGLTALAMEVFPKLALERGSESLKKTTERVMKKGLFHSKEVKLEGQNEKREATFNSSQMIDSRVLGEARKEA